MSATDTAARSNPLRGLGWGTFFAGFVPGLLQLQLGQKGRAITAFVSCTVLFFAGWALIQDRLFFYGLFSFEGGTTGTMASFGLPVILPEILNLPANAIGALMSYSSEFEAQRTWRLPRAMEDVGAFLTAASGMLAAFWAADAHFSLRRQRDGTGKEAEPKVAPALAAGVSWLLPGFGHILLGQRGKGLLIGAAVLVVFGAGLFFSEGHAVDRGMAPVWWIGQMLCGGGALFAAFVTAPLEMTAFPQHYELGLNLCTVAGLMNLVVMIDAFTVAERRTFPLRSGQEMAR